MKPEPSEEAGPQEREEEASEEEEEEDDVLAGALACLNLRDLRSHVGERDDQRSLEDGTVGTKSS